MIVWTPLPAPLLEAVKQSGFMIEGQAGQYVPFILAYDPQYGWQGAFASDDQRLIGRSMGSTAVARIGTSHVVVVPPHEWMPDRINAIQNGPS